MDFETDALVEQLARNEKKETFGLIICGLFHQPKPRQFADFYHQLIQHLEASFTEDEKQSIYLYPIAHLHITIATLFSFKHPCPASPDKCLQHWKDCFIQLKRSSRNKSIILTLDAIQLSKAAGYFLFKDETKIITNLRQSIREICVPEEGQPALQIPEIIHTTFIRFIKKLEEPGKFEEKFHRICGELLGKKEISLDIDEVCLALESYPYMHIECDEAHVLDSMKI